MECGDLLRNFLNALVIHLRGTKENPKSPTDVLAKHKAQIPAKEGSKDRPEFKAKPKDEEELEVTNRVGKEELKLITRKPRLKGPAKLQW
jgi:hypothetical protein